MDKNTVYVAVLLMDMEQDSIGNVVDTLKDMTRGNHINHWHGAVKFEHYVGEGILPASGYEYAAFAAYEYSGLIPELSIRNLVLEAINSTDDQNNDGSYAIVPYKGVVYDILWVPINEG